MAITGKNRIEVRYPIKPVNVYRLAHSGGSEPRGFCVNDAAKLLERLQLYERMAKTDAATKKSPKDRAEAQAKAAALNTAVAELAADVNRIEALSKGKAKPAACVYPTTGEDSSQAGTETRFKRRGTAFHEQFHAKVREIEHEHGLDYQGDCVTRKLKDTLTERYGTDFKGPNKAWRMLRWGTDAPSAIEEILARTEEVRKSCLRSVEDCDGINRYLAGQLITQRRNYDQARLYRFRGHKKFLAAGEPDACSMQRLSAGIAKDYGAASTLVLEAARACGVKRKP